MTDADLAFATLTELRTALASGAVGAEELAHCYLRRIAADASNSFITVCEEQALAAARAADAALAAGQRQPLLGLPIAHKDIFCTRGVRTTCASRMLATFVAPYDATVVARLKAAGAVTLGKTNMDEFAMGSSSETSYFGPVANPWDAARVAGGSSGGSAAAVAAGLAAAATGTDTGGSIRQPAAFCGVSGLKPTYGRVSRYGMVAFASSLDQGGPLARSVADLRLLLGGMEGRDPLDSTSAAVPATGPATAKSDRRRPLAIGMPVEYWRDLPADVGAVLAAGAETLRRLGHRCRDVSLPHTRFAVPAYYVIASAEASTNLARYDGVRYGHRAERPKDIEDLYRRSRSEGFGAEVKRRILTGTYALSVGYYDAYYRKAQRLRRLVRDDFLAAFADVDAILTPATPTPAFALRQESGAAPTAMYKQDVFTVPASLAGLPALALPCGQAGALPVGMQLIGPHFAENTLLSLGEQFQAETDWHRRRPPAAGGGPAP